MSYKRQSGLGLMDIVIGLLIGTLVTIAAVGSLVLFRQYSKTGITGNQALQNGINAIHNLQYHIKMAGLGFVANNTMACTSWNAVYGGNTIANNSAVAPVLLTSNNTDPTAPQTITVLYGNSIISGSPALMIAGTTSTDTSVNVNSSNAMQANDYALLASPGTTSACTLVKITSVTSSGSYATINYDAGGVASVSYPANSLVIDIGNPVWYTWRIANDNLQVQDNLTGTTMTVADNIVQLRAQYGITDGVSESIQSWVDPTGTWASPTAAQIAQIRAIRIAVVARSMQKEKPVSGTCNATSQAPIPWQGGSAVDLTANVDWKCYRYKVLETVVPLKNVLMGGVA